MTRLNLLSESQDLLFASLLRYLTYCQHADAMTEACEAMPDGWTYDEERIRESEARVMELAKEKTV